MKQNGTLKKYAVSLLFPAVLVVLMMAGAAMASFVELDVSDLSIRSDAVVIGEVLSKRSYWNEAHTLILTDYAVKVSEDYKQAVSGTVVVTVIGGEVDGMGLASSVMPVIEVGEKTVLFLKKIPDGGYGISGDAQGKMTVTGEDSAVRFDGRKVSLPQLRENVQRSLYR